MPWSASLDELLPHADAAVIAAPTDCTPQLVEQCAAAGVHVLCEKPLGFSARGGGARDLRALGRPGVLLWVGFQRRFDPDWRALARASVGRPQLLRVSHRNARAPAAVAELGDLFVDVAIHDLDAARWLVGEVAEVFAREHVGRGDHLAEVRERRVRLIDVSRSAAYGFECSAELVGTRATARGTGRAAAVSLLCDGQARTPLAADHAERHAEAYRAEVRQFAAAVGEAAEGPRAPAALARGCGTRPARTPSPR